MFSLYADDKCWDRFHNSYALHADKWKKASKISRFDENFVHWIRITDMS